MNKTWLITDTHFDHDEIGVYCDRPVGWMDKIFKSWRQDVKPEDLVIHVGDVQVGKGHNLLDLMNSLPGIKALTEGNHDTKSSSWYMRNGFAFSCQAMSYGKVTITHHPSLELFAGTDINIHGHVHNSVWKPNRTFQRLLAIEHTNYRPVDFLKWSSMARSPRKWQAYMKTWKVPNVVGKLKNGREIPEHHKGATDPADIDISGREVDRYGSL